MKKILPGFLKVQKHRRISRKRERVKEKNEE